MVDIAFGFFRYFVEQDLLLSWEVRKFSLLAFGISPFLFLSGWTDGLLGFSNACNIVVQFNSSFKL
jgi:hypothetical protein